MVENQKIKELSDLWDKWVGSSSMVVGLKRPVNFLGSIAAYKKKFLDFVKSQDKHPYKTIVPINIRVSKDECGHDRYTKEEIIKAMGAGNVSFQKGEGNNETIFVIDKSKNNKIVGVLI